MTIGGRKMMTGLVALVALSLGGCAYDDYGYGGASVGYGSGGYYDDGFGYGGGYPGYGYAGYGWYNDFYYPGTGYYVFDRGGRRHSWSPSQRDYWQARNRDRRQDREVRQQVRNAFDGRGIDDSRLRRGQRDRDATLTPEQRTQRQADRTVRREQQGATFTPEQRTQRQAERSVRREQRRVTGSAAGADGGFRQRSQGQSEMRAPRPSSAPRAAPSSSNRGIAGTVARRMREPN